MKIVVLDGAHKKRTEIKSFDLFNPNIQFNKIMGITRYPKFILKLACKLFRCDKIEIIMAREWL